LSRRDIETAELVATIERDPMLAARVLELSNSGAFGRLRRFQSIQHAIAFIGTNPLRRHAITWTIGGVLKRLPDSTYWSTTKFTMHSEAVALLADSLCDEIPIRGGDGAFIAGLIHDIGKFVICVEAADAIDTILSLREMGCQTPTECERDVLGIDHAEISSMAAERWGLPDEVCQAVHRHHEPEQDDTGAPRLSVALCNADGFVNSLGLSFLSTPADGRATLDWPGREKEVARSLERFTASMQATA
jgi:putative nucleotidyltransferase with HDIG domain